MEAVSGALKVNAKADMSPLGIRLMSPCARAEDIRTLIIGHSHAAPVIRALVSKGDAEQMRTVKLAHEAALGGLLQKPITSDYLDAAAQLGQTRNVALIWSGNQANADFLLSNQRPFDFVPRGYPDANTLAGHQIVPEAALRAHFAGSVSELSNALSALGQPVGQKRFVICIQPPLHDNALIRQRMHDAAYFRDLARRLGREVSDIAITAPSVRRKLWFLLMAMYRETAEAHCATFVDVPPDAIDDQGFLKLAFAAGDVTHPNAAYGRLVIERLVSHIAAAA